MLALLGENVRASLALIVAAAPLLPHKLATEVELLQPVMRTIAAPRARTDRMRVSRWMLGGQQPWPGTFLPRALAIDSCGDRQPTAFATSLGVPSATPAFGAYD